MAMAGRNRKAPKRFGARAELSSDSEEGELSANDSMESTYIPPEKQARLDDGNHQLDSSENSTVIPDNFDEDFDRINSACEINNCSIESINSNDSHSNIGCQTDERNLTTLDSKFILQQLTKLNETQHKF